MSFEMSEGTDSGFRICSASCQARPHLYTPGNVDWPGKKVLGMRRTDRHTQDGDQSRQADRCSHLGRTSQAEFCVGESDRGLLYAARPYT